MDNLKPNPIFYVYVYIKVYMYVYVYAYAYIYNIYIRSKRQALRKDSYGDFVKDVKTNKTEPLHS